MQLSSAPRGLSDVASAPVNRIVRGRAIAQPPSPAQQRDKAADNGSSQATAPISFREVDVAVIGSGIGGLSAASLLARCFKLKKWPEHITSGAARVLAPAQLASDKDVIHMCKLRMPWPAYAI